MLWGGDGRASPAKGANMNLSGMGAGPFAAKSAGFTTQGAGEHKRSVAREDFIRELYKDVFEASGITVFGARDGEEAVKLFKNMSHRPDAIIMDHRMPGKDGIQTTREILQLDPRVPIIFSSADESVREEALAAGAVSFWAKPFSVTLLVSAMLDIVEAKKRSG
jgi:CheY-like chemotaxis protein